MKNNLYNSLQQSLINKKNYSGLGCPSIVEEVCNNNNLDFEINPEYNGWEVDWYGEILTYEGDHYCNVYGSMYYGTINIEF